MKKDNVVYIIITFLVFVILQIPLLHQFIVMNTAFCFFYVGFLIFLYVSVPPIYQLPIGFLVGFFIDIFCHTPGIHAFSCVFLCFIKKRWLMTVFDDYQRTEILDIYSMGIGPYFLYLVPLVAVHHFLIFTIENAGFFLFFEILFPKILYSTIYSSFTIFVLNHLLHNKK